MQKMIFQFTDKTLTVYQWSSGGLQTDSVYYLNNQEDLELFTKAIPGWIGITGYVLLNLSSEEYHEEQLPHIQGKDRKLMLERKLGKLYPNSDYTHYKLLKREKTGRKDDVYLLSGIADTTIIEPYLDIINEQQIEISGVYSTPLIIHEIIKPLKHSSQVLVIATGKPADDRLPFRQTFLNDKLIHFNRLTSIVTSGEPDDLATKFNREIQRTWQYLQNRQELKPGVDLEVILIAPDNVEAVLNNQMQAPHCQYVFAKLEELVKLHQAEDKIQQPNFASLTAFLLGKTVHKTPHYKPKKLAFVRLHQQAKRYLLAASIALAIITFGITGSNLVKSHQMKKTNQQMNHTLLGNSEHVDKLKSWFNARQSSPKKMESVVITARKITEGSPLPQRLFETISSGYNNFNDLSLKTLEWKTSPTPENNTQRTNHQTKNNSEEPIPKNTVLVTLEGEVLGFHGNYRQAIERIQTFANGLNGLDSVTSVVIRKLPLDINPATNISRSIADQTAPTYALDLQINTGAL